MEEFDPKFLAPYIPCMLIVVFLKQFIIQFSQQRKEYRIFNLLSSNQPIHSYQRHGWEIQNIPYRYRHSIRNAIHFNYCNRQLNINRNCTKSMRITFLRHVKQVELKKGSKVLYLLSNRFHLKSILCYRQTLIAKEKKLSIPCKVSGSTFKINDCVLTATSCC